MNVTSHTWPFLLGAVCVLAGTLGTRPAAADASGAAAPPAAPTTAAEESDISQDYVERVAWAGFITAGVGYTLWAVTGSISLAKSESLKEDCPNDECEPDRESDLDEARGLAQAATAGFVLGVLGTAWGVIALIVAGEEDETAEPTTETDVSVRPQIGPGFVGVTAQF